MPAPTPEEVTLVKNQLQAAIQNHIYAPLAALLPEDHQVLVNLHVHDPVAAGVLLDQLREYARTLENPWPTLRIDRLSFNYYVRGARQVLAAAAAAERQSNVVRLSIVRQGQQAQQQQTPQGPVDSPDDLTPEQMIETKSLRLIAIGTLLLHRPGRLWTDDFYKRPYTDWRGEQDETTIPSTPVDDATTSRIMTWLQGRDTRLGKATERTMLGAIDYVVDRVHKNAPREWLESLRWDETPRLDKVMTEAFGAPYTEFNQAAGRCWFVSMAARIMEPGCKVDTMPVLCGGQGAMKSQALEIIGGPWYRAASSNIDSKDFLQELHGAMVMEIPELHSMVASRHGAARIKAVLSTRIDHFRTPYGRFPADHKRTAVLAGTTNNADWHGDDTGGRRFWPIHIGALVNLAWLRENRDQLFAEAVYRYRAGEKWWDVPEEEQRVLIEAERAVDPWEEMIASRLDDPSLYDGGYLQNDARLGEGTEPQSDWGTVVTVQRVGIQWLRMTPDMLGRNSRRIANVLRALGWEQKRARVSNALHARIHWLPKEPEERRRFLIGNDGAATPQSPEPPPPDEDDDIPF